MDVLSPIKFWNSSTFSNFWRYSLDSHHFLSGRLSWLLCACRACQRSGDLTTFESSAYLTFKGLTWEVQTHYCEYLCFFWRFITLVQSCFYRGVQRCFAWQLYPAAAFAHGSKMDSPISVKNGNLTVTYRNVMGVTVGASTTRQVRQRSCSNSRRQKQLRGQEKLKARLDRDDPWVSHIFVVIFQNIGRSDTACTTAYLLLGFKLFERLRL